MHLNNQVEEHKIFCLLHFFVNYIHFMYIYTHTENNKGIFYFMKCNFK